MTRDAGLMQALYPGTASPGELPGSGFGRPSLSADRRRSQKNSCAQR